MNKYTIFPFHHIRLINNDILMVNAAGEFYFVRGDDFERLINYELDNDETVFLNLKGKHFLADSDLELPVRLLATKLRTKKAFLRDFTSLHMMVITLRCNHRCRYCQVSSEEADAYKWDMTPKTAVKIVDFIFSSPSPSIKIEFQGGEPLLNWQVIQTVVEYAEKKSIECNKKLEFVICTNLTVIDADKLKFARDHRINLSTSLDGTASVHDENRLLRVGKSSYALFMEKLELARSIIGHDHVSPLMTVTRSSLQHIKDTIDEYVRLGFNGIFIRALNPYGFAREEESNLGYGIGDFLAAYREGFEYILELNLNGRFFVEYYASLLLSRILTPFSTGFVDLQSPSGAGIAGVIYDYNGDVYPADEARMLARMGDRKFLMGNVFKQDYLDIFDGSVLHELVENSCVETLPGCFSCAYQLYCGADPIRNYVDQGDIVGHRPTGDFCAKNSYIIGMLFERIRESDSRIMDIFWSWITNRPIRYGRNGE